MFKKIIAWWHCKVLGNHEYLDRNFVAHFNPLNRMWYFRNHCVKCGKEQSVGIPEEILINAFLDQVEQEREELKATRELWRLK